MSTKFKVALGSTIAALSLVAGSVFAGYAPTAAFTRSLTTGSTGSDVKMLQEMLNACADTALAVTAGSAGSAGYESMYFGNATKAAVAKYQTKYNISPAVGYFGPMTRANVAAKGNECGGTTTTLPPGCVSTSGFSPITGQPCSGGTTTQTGPVTASLSATNPAPSVLVAGQATADLAHFTFTGTGTVTNVTLQRIGVSADTTPANVYLFDGAMRITDAASVTNGGAITFNNASGLFTVNGSKTIAVKADIAGSTNGQTVGVRLVSFMSMGATAATTANLSGNTHSIATATLAAVSAGTVTPSGSTINPGPAQTLWQSTLSVTQRDVWLKRIAFRQIGSAPANAVSNFKLYVNGVQVGSTVAGMDSMSYVTFDLSTNPVLLAAGSRLVRVEADVVSGASRTVQLSLRQAADVDFVDKDYGVNITPTSTPWVSASAITIAGGSGGSMIVQKDTSVASGDVTADATDVVVGKFTAQAFGEAIKIETIKAAFYSSDATIDSLRNGRVLINGVQYGSTATLVTCDTDSDADCDGSDTSGTGTSFTLNYVVPAGQIATIEIHSDVYDNDGTNGISANDTLVGAIAVGTSNAVKQDSLGYLSVPSSIVLGQTMTVKTASASLAKDTSYANQTINLPQTAYKLGDWNLTAGTAEDLNVNTVSVDFASVSGSTFTAADLTNVYVKVGSNMSTVYATVSASGNTFSLPTTMVAKGSSVVVEVYANLLSGGVTATDSIRATATVSGNSAVSGTSVTTSAVAGQTIAYGSGTLTISLDGSSPLNQIAAGNQEVIAGTFKFQASNDNFTVKEVDVSVPSATAASAVSMVSLYDGATLVQSLPLSGNDADSGTNNMASFTSLNWVVTSNTTKVLTVKFMLNTIGTGAGTSQQNVAAQLDRVRYQDSAGSVSTYTTDTNANELYVYKTIPTISRNNLAGTLVNGTEMDLYSFTVSASSSGPVSIKQLSFPIGWTDNVGTANTLEIESMKLYENGVDVTASVNILDNAGADVEDATGLLEANTHVRVVWASALESTVAAGTTKTYVLKGTPSGFTAPADDDTFSLYLVGDAAHNSTSVYLNAGDADGIIDLDTTAGVANASASEPFFIWSDNSSSTHSASVGASSSGDWANGYKVLNLNLSAQSWNN